MLHNVSKMFNLATLMVGAGLLGLSTAQYFPPTPEGITVLKSQFHENVSISYKEVRQLITSVIRRVFMTPVLLTFYLGIRHTFARQRQTSGLIADMLIFHPTF
jgi:hypothetical protein